jgi:hypothetical protein
MGPLGNIGYAQETDRLSAKCESKTLTFTGLIFGKAKRDLRREEDPRFEDFSRRSC